MSATVLLNLLKELRKRDEMRGLPSILSIFLNEFNKFNKTGARMLDCIYVTPKPRRHVIQLFPSPFVLTLKAPITTKVVCLCHLMRFLVAILTNSVDPNQTAPSSYRSSLI